ncbi:MAG: hypothetical protein JKY50_06555 [Oleispira sp.]|nr:hypothetical protein [Oleispira sp.]MBL4881831.1 hypothetical protein [Oleispira sp.]
MSFKILVTGLCIALLAGCVSKDEDDEDIKTSSDFATTEIEAYYAIEVMAENEVHFYANFYADNQSLELTGDDKVFVEINSTSEALLGQTASGITTYSLIESLDSIASSYIFDLSRTDFDSAPRSIVTIPQTFESTQPLASTQVSAVNNKFPLRWQGLALTEAELAADPEAIVDGKQFTVRYDFDCRNGGNPNALGSFVEKLIDDGEHSINLNKVFGISQGSSGLSSCESFDITLIRSDSNGYSDPAFKGGSNTGAQVRFIRGLSIVDIL